MADQEDPERTLARLHAEDKREQERRQKDQRSYHPKDTARQQKWLWASLAFLAVWMVVLYFYSHAQHSAQSVNTTTTTSASTTLSAAQAWNAIGQEATVQFSVGYPYTSTAGDEFLNEKQNYLSGFTAVIYRSELSNFQTDPVTEYGNSTVDVTGTITQYEGHPEIIVSEPSQIQAAP